MLIREFDSLYPLHLIYGNIMITAKTYYLIDPSLQIIAGPFGTIEQAIRGKDKFIPPYASLLRVASSGVELEIIE